MTSKGVAVGEGLSDVGRRWQTLAVLHDRVDAHLERALQAAHGVSVREFALLAALSGQHNGEGGHLQMRQLGDAVALSQSATTRLVTRLEDRGLLTRYICPTDRRGIYTDVTPAGLELLRNATPTHEEALREALDAVAGDPAWAPFVGLLRD